jgi:hypothetical protein
MADWEFHRLALPRGTTLEQARRVLTVAAAFGGWELRRSRTWPDGRRHVDLVRKVDGARDGLPPLPGLSL